MVVGLDVGFGPERPLDKQQPANQKHEQPGVRSPELESPRFGPDVGKTGGKGGPEMPTYGTVPGPEIKRRR